ncbi:unnamed protein product [Didymodactylos carnosus]|uniref:Nuclear transport factor 2 n=1 Tax=Didymodactylos carnosus TaxID=1234261 RepID=A0A814EE37_9BILA|nr:unnamed protein product [Didymodactylos carnosus]CAF0967640.1 unnamed protein product [Didymodactylos carnosus]CAF3596503.1 unnamed protein product [Didymodactylos carnosus]CAF3740993.1 unnamed protein product [Didymodactylos carnosus]
MTDEQVKDVGKAFIQHYYQTFDTGSRESVAALYEPSVGRMDFNGAKTAVGVAEITERLRSYTFTTINHTVSTIDIQQTYDNGILIVVTGMLRADNDQPMQFTETFLLKGANNSWFVVNNFFRLVFHG